MRICICSTKQMDITASVVRTGRPNTKRAKSSTHTTCLTWTQAKIYFISDRSETKITGGEYLD